MIIDIHTHTFPPRVAGRALASMQANCHTALFSDGTAEGLARRAGKAGIGVSVVQPVATRPDQPAHINDSVIALNRDFSGTGLLSFGAMHPLCEAWEAELDRLAEAGVKGIKLHPVYTHTDIDKEESVRILRKCRELGLTVLIHCGWDVGIPGSDEAAPEKIRRALDAAGPVKLIAAHMAGWRCWEEAAGLLADTGVYPDTAFSLGRMTPAPDGWPWTEEELRLLDARAFCDLVRAYGADHVLFGTDSPWADQEEEVRRIQALPLSEEEKRGILGGNTEKLLGLA